VVQGALPTGLTFKTNGTITGTPVGTGPSYVTIQAKDTSGLLVATTAFVLGEAAPHQLFTAGDL
jgi:hypothetical protein